MIGHSASYAGGAMRHVWAPLFAFAAVALSTVAIAAEKGVVNPLPAELQTALQTINSAGPLNFTSANPPFFSAKLTSNWSPPWTCTLTGE